MENQSKKAALIAQNTKGYSYKSIEEKKPIQLLNKADINRNVGIPSPFPTYLDYEVYAGYRIKS